MAADDLHHAVFADQFQLLNPFHFHFLFCGKVMLALKLRQFFLKLQMFIVEFLKLWFLIQQGDDRLFLITFNTAASFD